VPVAFAGVTKHSVPALIETAVMSSPAGAFRTALSPGSSIFVAVGGKQFPLAKANAG
jgi:hypothetical protein